MIHPGADITMITFERMLLEESHSANNFHRQINDTQRIIRREIFRPQTRRNPSSPKLFTIDPRFAVSSVYARSSSGSRPQPQQLYAGKIFDWPRQR
jgi:hypothetical protein